MSQKEIDIPNEFKKAVNFVRSSDNKITVSDDVKLEFYGLYKTALGTKYEELGFLSNLNPVASKKNAAHKKHKNKSQLEAMVEYITLCQNTLNYKMKI